MKKYTYLVNFDSQTLERVGESFAVKGDGGIAELEFVIPSNFGIPANQALWRVFFKLPGEKESHFETLPTVAATQSGDYVTSWVISKAITQKAGRLAFSLAAISGNDIQWNSRTVIMQVPESQYQPESEEAEKPYTGRLDALEGSMAAIRGEFAEVQEDFEELKETATLGTPTPESLVANMQEGHIYVYTGTETGYTAGHLYYYVNGTLTDGGQYGGTTVDATLTQSGQAADAKKTGDEISQIKEDLSSVSSVPTTVRAAIYTLLNSAAYTATGLTDEIAVVQSWAAEVTAIALDQSTISISGASTVQLTATTTPSGGVVSWESSDTSIATVSLSGLVTGVNNGTATITAMSGDVSATCAVTVSGFAELVTSRYITVANETPTSGYINDDGEISSYTDAYFIDTFYDALPFSLGASDGILGGTLRGAYYDANYDFMSRDYVNALIKPIATDSVFQKVGWGRVSPDYIFLLNSCDDALFTNDGYSIDSNGDLMTETGFHASDLIRITSGCDKYVVYAASGDNGFNVAKVAFYDSDQTFISRAYTNGGTGIYGDIPSGAVYYRMSKNSAYSTFNMIARSV